jgi:nitrate/nitrite transporter NarK
VFKLVLVWFPDKVGAVTGVVGAAGGLGGFFPPLVMGVVKSATGGYALGFALMALVALRLSLRAARPRRSRACRPGPAVHFRPPLMISAARDGPAPPGRGLPVAR